MRAWLDFAAAVHEIVTIVVRGLPLVVVWRVAIRHAHGVTDWVVVLSALFVASLALLAAVSYAYHPPRRPARG